MASAVRPLSGHALRRRLSGAQDNMLSTGYVRDALRQASSAEARSRIRTAVEAGGSMETTAAASLVTRAAIPLRLSRLRALRQETSMTTDVLRSVQRQERTADATAMIRRAVNGGGTEIPAEVVAERFAGSTAQGRQLP